MADQADDKPKRKPRRKLDPSRHWRRGTNFYPNGDADGALGPVGPVVPVEFQPVIPSYDLSTNETRESGVGPAFDAAPHFSDYIEEESDESIEEEEADETEPHRNPPEPGTGNRLDLDA